MNPRICICCGEAMMERGNALSRNPNLCASCSSLVDGMEEPSLPPVPAAHTPEPRRRAAQRPNAPVTMGATPLPALPPFSAS